MRLHVARWPIDGDRPQVRVDHPDHRTSLEISTAPAETPENELTLSQPDRNVFGLEISVEPFHAQFAAHARLFHAAKRALWCRGHGVVYADDPGLKPLGHAGRDRQVVGENIGRQAVGVALAAAITSSSLEKSSKGITGANGSSVMSFIVPLTFRRIVGSNQ